MKFRATIKVTVEYEPNPADYGTSNLTRMLELGRQALEDDPMLFIDRDEAVWDLKIEQIEKENER